jgi:hypothetical protein
LKCALCDCSPGNVARLSTTSPRGPNRSVNIVARLLTGAARLNGSCCAYAAAGATTHTVTKAAIRIIDLPFVNGFP